MPKTKKVNSKRVKKALECLKGEAHKGEGALIRSVNGFDDGADLLMGEVIAENTALKEKLKIVQWALNNELVTKALRQRLHRETMDQLKLILENMEVYKND